MPPRKTRIILLVALGHLAVLLLLILLAAPRVDKYYTSPVTAVELVSALEIDLPPEEEEAAEPEPDPRPDPVPDPPPEPAVAEEAPPPPRKVIRRVAAPEIPKTDLQRRLRERLDRVEATPRRPAAVSAPREDPSLYSWYYDYIQSRMQDVWKQPTRAAVGRDEPTAVVTFRVFRDGRIENIRLRESSGSQVMDDSVLQAVRTADPLSPLPSGIKGAYEDFLILFELK